MKKKIIITVEDRTAEDLHETMEIITDQIVRGFTCGTDSSTDQFGDEYGYEYNVIDLDHYEDSLADDLVKLRTLTEIITGKKVDKHV